MLEINLPVHYTRLITHGEEPIIVDRQIGQLHSSVVVGHMTFVNHSADPFYRVLLGFLKCNTQIRDYSTPTH